MAKYLFPNLTEEYAAIVSTHGYFEIQKKESYNSYKSGIGPVFDRNGVQCPDPVVVYSGPVEDLGLHYDAASDDLVEWNDPIESIEAAVLKYLEGKLKAK